MSAKRKVTYRLCVWNSSEMQDTGYGHNTRHETKVALSNDGVGSECGRLTKLTGGYYLVRRRGSPRFTMCHVRVETKSSGGESTRAGGLKDEYHYQFVIATTPDARTFHLNKGDMLRPMGRAEYHRFRVRLAREKRKLERVLTRLCKKVSQPKWDALNRVQRRLKDIGRAS